MKKPSFAIAAALACSAVFCSGVHIHGRDLNAPLLGSYDYIVVGCGISGLVVTNRLSEDTSVTVLCIEAGDADHYEAIVQDPVYVGADIGGIYDWDLTTVPQTQLDGAARPMPQGKVLGGGSILNAMCWNRGGSDDYDAWAALGNPGWDWAGILPYFMKSETYTPVYSQEIAHEYSINYNPAVHGTSGPVQVSYPKFFYPQSVNLFAGLNYLGVPTQFDPNDGTSAGAAFVPTDLDPNNQTRSDARRTYFDPYASRGNMHVITGQHVTRVLIENTATNPVVSNPASGGNTNGNGAATGSVDNSNGFGFGPQGSTPPLGGQTSSRFARRDASSSNLRITGVEFASSATAPRQTVYATREVIVAAGALHSTQLLQLSGIGPASLLQSLNIPVALDLPGVGNNLQDHCLVGTYYPYNNASFPSPTELTTNATYNTQAEQEYYANKTGPWTAGSPNALAFNPLPLISNNSVGILWGATFQDPAQYLVQGTDPTIVAGYARQKQSIVQRLAQTNVASYEIINNNAGSLTVAVMHPLSRGTCHITSPNPFDPPAIDPRWLTNPVDREVLVEALLFNRRILGSPPMLELQAAQFVPPPNADIAAINQVIDNGIRTEFHPSGTCAMLPLDQGGVVDSHLRVWGSQNLRVVDASIFPLIPAAHLQAVVYAVAEKAADIIKADNVGVQPSSPPTSSTSATSTASLSNFTALSSSSTTSGRFSFSNSTTTSASSTISSTSSSIDVTVTSASSSGSITAEATLPVTLSSLLSTLDASKVIASQSSVEATTQPPPTLSVQNPSQLSSSVSSALSSGGVPQSVISSLVPIVVGSVTTEPTSSTVATASATSTTTTGEEAQQAAINAFIQWLLNFFNLQ